MLDESDVRLRLLVSHVRAFRQYNPQATGIHSCSAHMKSHFPIWIRRQSSDLQLNCEQYPNHADQAWTSYDQQS